MISVHELINEFKLSLNKVSREDNFSLPTPDIITFLNKAQMSWIKTKINPNNPLKVGYESIRKRIDDLQGLKENDFKLKATKSSEPFFKSYISSLKDAPNYMMYVAAHCTAKKGDCQDTLAINLVREGEIKTQYWDVLYNPNFEWRETLATLGNDNIYVYVTDFEIVSTHLTYLRYPKSIDIEGYIKLDGSQSINQDSELPEYAKQDLIDLAVKFAAHATDNVLQSQAAEDRIIKNNE
jgi:hypothetical protein